MKLDLIARNKSEELVKTYLEQNASEILAEKINNGVLIVKDGKTVLNVKTLSGFMEYAKSEARNLAAKGASYACVEDSTVYGWAIHYFEEDKITEKLYNEDGSEYKSKVKNVDHTKAKTSKTENDMVSMGTDEVCEDMEKKNKHEVVKVEQPKKKLPKGVSEGQISFFDFGD